MKHRLLFSLFACGCWLMALTGCSQFSDDTNPYDFAESEKGLSGVWKLKTVTRNNIDITSDMDFSKFALHMNTDGTYHIENYLPFVVEKDGKWMTDDPRYPFRLSFVESGSETGVSVDFNIPVVNGQRALQLSLSPGCASNVYTYKLEKEQ